MARRSISADSLLPRAKVHAVVTLIYSFDVALVRLTGKPFIKQSGRRAVRSSIVGWLVTVICQTTSAQVQPPDAASLQAFYQEWMGAAAQQGPAAYASYYAVNGQILPPNAAPVVGREAIADWLERSQAETAYSVRPEGIHVDEVRFLDRNWAIYRSTLRGQRVPKAGGEPSPFETKYFDVLHRPDNGRWEVVYRMWSDNLR